MIHGLYLQSFKENVILTSNIWQIWHITGWPYLSQSRSQNWDFSLKVNFLARESAWKAACHSTKMLLQRIDSKIYCKLERFCFILSMFWNTEFTRHLQSFMTPIYQFRQWFTKCIKSTMFHFLAFYSLDIPCLMITKFSSKHLIDIKAGSWI